MRGATAVTALALTAGLVLTGCFLATDENTDSISAVASAAPSPSPSAIAASSAPTSRDAAAPVSATVPATPVTYGRDHALPATLPYGPELTVKIPVTGPAKGQALGTDLGVDSISHGEVGLDNRAGTKEDSAVHDDTVVKQPVAGQLNDPQVVVDNTGLNLNGGGASTLEGTDGWVASTGTTPPERNAGTTAEPNDMAQEQPTTPAKEAEEVEEAELIEQPQEAEPAEGRVPVAGGEFPVTPDPAPIPGPMPGAIPHQNFTYEQARVAWQDGMPYYDAFCLHYTPVTDGEVSQCQGIEAGTVDKITGEKVGP